MGDKHESTMNLKIQIFIHDFSTVGPESVFYNDMNGFPKHDCIYWSISLWKRLALFALTLCYVLQIQVCQP